MQASLARWAVVTFCTLGSLGCQSSKPGWWPGQKTIPYSQSSSAPPAAVQQQQQQQYPTPANGYIDQANAGQGGAANAYQQAGGYPIGNNPQAGYGAAANDPNPYGQAQQQQPMAGAYPENYPNTANPYAQPTAMGGYADPQAGYPGSQGYGQAGGNPYGSTGAAPGYDPVRTADARQAAGGGYGTNSPYDPNTYGGGGGYPPQDQYNPQTPAAPVGGYPQTQSPTEQAYPNTGGYQPGGAGTGYQPGATGYNPPGTTQYQSPTGPYADQTAAAQTAAAQTDPHYRPGSTSDYSPTAGAAGSAASTAATGYGQPATTTAAAPGGYGNTARYPSTTGTGAAPASPTVDRYGRPIQEAAGGYGTDGTMQR